MGNRGKLNRPWVPGEARGALKPEARGSSSAEHDDPARAPAARIEPHLRGPQPSLLVPHSIRHAPDVSPPGEDIEELRDGPPGEGAEPVSGVLHPARVWRKPLLGMVDRPRARDLSDEIEAGQVAGGLLNEPLTDGDDASRQRDDRLARRHAHADSLSHLGDGWSVAPLDAQLARRQVA